MDSGPLNVVPSQRFHVRDSDGERYETLATLCKEYSYHFGGGVFDITDLQYQINKDGDITDIQVMLKTHK